MKFDLDIEIIKGQDYLFKSIIFDTLIYLVKGLMPFDRIIVSYYTIRVSLIGSILSLIFKNNYHLVIGNINLQSVSMK